MYDINFLNTINNNKNALLPQSLGFQPFQVQMYYFTHPTYTLYNYSPPYGNRTWFLMLVLLLYQDELLL